MKSDQPIGVIDSGVGGLSVLKCLQEHLPHEHFLYLGDTARTPYGVRDRQEIEAMVAELVDYLAGRQIKQLIVACNTITVLGEATIRGRHPFHVLGMSMGVEPVLAATKNKQVGILATDFTVSTMVHAKELRRADPLLQVYEQGCRKFVPLIEEERFGSPELAAAVSEYAAPLKERGVDTVMLSCTHYPFVAQDITDVFGPQVTIIDPAEDTVEHAKEDLVASGLARTEGEGSCEICFTSDMERGKRLAARMLSLERCRFKLVDLHSHLK